MRLSDGHLARIPHGAEKSRRPSLPHTPIDYLFHNGLNWEHKKKTTTEKPKEKNSKTESDEPVDKKGLSKAAIAMILMLVFCI